MANIPLQSLERANFTDDSNGEESTRRVNVENDSSDPIPVIQDETQHNIQNQNLLAAIERLSKELQKINFYFEYMFEFKPSDSDISDTLV